MPTIAQKLGFYLEQLSSRPLIGGLQISDTALLYLSLDGGTRSVSLRVPPGVVREGKIVDEASYLAVLKQFRKQVQPVKVDVRVPVIVTLPPSLVYIQSFVIPNVGREKLSEAAKLNMQMISPIPPEAAYMSFEIQNETAEQYELLGGFAEKAVIDAYSRLLDEAKFSPIAFEFPSLSLTRLIASVVGPLPASTLTFQISSDGINLSIFRGGKLFFDYFRSWRSIQGERREISKGLFEEVIAQEVQKVLNFAMGKFNERPAQAYLIAPGFEGDMQQFLESRFGLSVVPLVLRSSGLEPAWYVALGAALRGRIDRAADVFISLAPASSAELFYKEQTLNFIALWRNIMAGVLLVFIFFFGGSVLFLRNQVNEVVGRLSEFPAELKTSDFAALTLKANEFNDLVRRAALMRGSAGDWQGFLQKFRSITAANGIIVDHLDLTSLTAPMALAARAKDNAAILQFKAALGSDPHFGNVNLDVSKISTLEDNTVGFTITFQYKQ